MDKWLKPTLAYVPNWLDMKMRHSRPPGYIVAIAQHGRVVSEHAFGSAGLATNGALTPRHRFRVASHSKSFTVSGITLLRERKNCGWMMKPAPMFPACTRQSPARR